jgi:16S rRNA (guanine1207-N2)-methyltransferase
MSDEEIESKPPLEARVAERCALQVAQTFSGNRILCSSLGRGQAAAALANDRPEAEVTLWYLDQYWQQLAATEIGQHPGLSLVCSADLPPGPFDLAVLPFSFRGEAELTRDLIQDAFGRLGIDGHLVVSTDNPRDRWLHDQLREMFPKVTVISLEEAVVYVVKKRADQKRPRPLKCEFAFRDGEQMVRLASRPGVFSHRRLDPGARQLIDAVSWPVDASPGKTLRVLDIGCGCGAVGVAIAVRAQGGDRGEPVPIEVLAIDSNARAVACTAESAELNAVTTLTARLNCVGEVDQPASYDLAVANPPYYADFRIAKLFVESAHKALHPGGMLYLVTKNATWYQENLFPGWRDIKINPSGQYFIVTARRG